MRPQSLQAIASLQKGPSIPLHKARLGCVTPAARSLEVLREYLQPKINQEIRKVRNKIRYAPSRHFPDALRM